MRPLRPLACLVPAVLLVLGVSPVRARPAAPAGPSMIIHERQTTATTDFRWVVTLHFRNSTPQGVYTDSLTCVAEDLDPGITRGPRTRNIPINFVKRQVPALGTQDSTVMAFSYNALYEHARLVFRFYTHDQDKHAYVAADTIEMLPTSFSQLNPSARLKTDGGEIEYYYVRGRGGEGSAPTVLLIHGDQSHARHMLPLVSDIADRGYNVMAVSQPGYGLSGGKPDLMGPASIRAVEAALTTLRRARGVDSTKVVVWGVERGATIAARLAMTHPELAGAIAVRGLYDLPALARGSKTLRETFVQEAGRDTAAWVSRSPAALPPKLATRLLVEYSPNDPGIPSTQAQAFVAALQAAGQPVESQSVEGADRPLPSGPARDEAYAFLERLFPH